LPCRGLHELEELVETKRHGIAEIRCGVCNKFLEINSLLVAATPKLPMDVVLAELKKIRSQLAAIGTDVTVTKHGVAELDSDLRQMIGQVNEQFDLFMHALTDLAKDGPRLFSIEPVETGFWGKTEVDRREVPPDALVRTLSAARARADP